MGNQEPAAVAEAPRSLFEQLEAFGRTYLVERSPFTLPEHHKQSVVRWLPFIVALCVPVQLATIGLAIGVSVLSVLLSAPSWIGAAVAVVTAALDVAALPGLFRQQRRGIRLVALSDCVYVADAVLSLDLVGAAGGIAALWVVFQVFDRYDEGSEIRA